VSYICLILSGAALLINGLGLLGRIPAKDSGYFNLLIGGTQLILAVLIAVTANGAATALLGVSGVFLFGLTYAYVGLNSLLNLGSVGLGWFCGLVALLGVAYSALNLGTDPLLSVLWLAWAALWTLFFLLLALGISSLSTYTGWALILTSQATTTLPAILGLIGAWPSGATAAVIALAVVAALFVAARLLSAPASRAAVADASDSVPA
jgi:hypothetical protein